MLGAKEAEYLLPVLNVNGMTRILLLLGERRADCLIHVGMKSSFALLIIRVR